MGAVVKDDTKLSKLFFPAFVSSHSCACSSIAVSGWRRVGKWGIKRCEFEHSLLNISTAEKLLSVGNLDSASLLGGPGETPCLSTRCPRLLWWRVADLNLETLRCSCGFQRKQRTVCKRICVWWGRKNERHRQDSAATSSISTLSTCIPLLVRI